MRVFKYSIKIKFLQTQISFSINYFLMEKTFKNLFVCNGKSGMKGLNDCVTVLLDGGVGL